MKRSLILSFAAIASLSLCAAETPSELSGAIQKLADQPNYSWKTTVEMAGGGGGGRGRPGPVDGKIEKGGPTWLSIARGSDTIEAVLKGEAGAIKTPDGWKTVKEAADAAGGGGGGGQPNPARYISRMVQSFKAPTVQAQDLVAKSKDLKKDGDKYSADLTEEGVKAFIAPGGGRNGGQGPTITNPKGSVQLWIHDGQLSKYQFHVQGSMSRNGNDVEIDRTTTVEIKDVGTTKVEIPEDAKKKLS